MESQVFLFLSKLATWAVMPFSIAGLAILAVLVAGGGRRWARVLLGLALLCLWGGGSRFVSEPLVRSLESYSRPPAPDIRSDAIVALGGGVQAAIPPRRATEVSEAGDRVLEAARLWREGRAPWIVVTGGRWDESEKPHTQASSMADLLRFFGVPRDAILLADRSRTTREDALEVRAELAPRGFTRILLVTSALHMRRATALFRAQGFEVIPAPTDFIAIDVPERSFQLEVLTSLPNVDSLSLTTRALHEWLGLTVGAALGWSE